MCQRIAMAKGPDTDSKCVPDRLRTDALSAHYPALLKPSYLKRWIGPFRWFSYLEVLFRTPRSAASRVEACEMSGNVWERIERARTRIGPVINKMLFIFYCKWSKSLWRRLDCDDTSALYSLLYRSFPFPHIVMHNITLQNLSTYTRLGLNEWRDLQASIFTTLRTVRVPQTYFLQT